MKSKPSSNFSASSSPANGIKNVSKDSGDRNINAKIVLILGLVLYFTFVFVSPYYITFVFGNTVIMHDEYPWWVEGLYWVSMSMILGSCFYSWANKKS